MNGYTMTWTMNILFIDKVKGLIFMSSGTQKFSRIAFVKPIKLVL